jgi:hypothetical protein
MPIQNSPSSPSSALTAKSNSVSKRRSFVPRPELCRKNRKGKVFGYGLVPGWNLTLHEIEDGLQLPHS